MNTQKRIMKKSFWIPSLNKPPTCSYEESGKEHSSTSKHKVANDATSFMFANRSEEEESTLLRYWKSWINTGLIWPFQNYLKEELHQNRADTSSKS